MDEAASWQARGPPACGAAFVSPVLACVHTHVLHCNPQEAWPHVDLERASDGGGEVGKRVDSLEAGGEPPVP